MSITSHPLQQRWSTSGLFEQEQHLASASVCPTCTSLHLTQHLNHIQYPQLIFSPLLPSEITMIKKSHLSLDHAQVLPVCPPPHPLPPPPPPPPSPSPLHPSDWTSRTEGVMWVLFWAGPASSQEHRILFEVVIRHGRLTCKINTPGSKLPASQRTHSY